MVLPDVFHLHYHVPDVGRAARALARHGIAPVDRFGSVDGESVSVPAGDDDPAGFRLRLQTNRGGRADVTLAPGPRLDFDHFGVAVDDVSAVVDRAESAGWSVTTNPRRTFLVTPWGFRIEVQDAGGDVVSGLGRADECRFAEVTLAAPIEVRDDLERGLRGVLGDVSNLRVVPVRGPTPAVTAAMLSGSAVVEPWFEMSSLASRRRGERGPTA